MSTHLQENQESDNNWDFLLNQANLALFSFFGAWISRQGVSLFRFRRVQNSLKNSLLLLTLGSRESWVLEGSTYQSGCQFA